MADRPSGDSNEIRGLRISLIASAVFCVLVIFIEFKDDIVRGLMVAIVFLALSVPLSLYVLQRRRAADCARGGGDSQPGSRTGS
jgi:hypothetical protein